MIFLTERYQDLTIEEVAVVFTGMSDSAIKTNLFFARQNIRKKLARLEVSILTCKELQQFLYSARSEDFDPAEREFLKKLLLIAETCKTIISGGIES